MMTSVVVSLFKAFFGAGCGGVGHGRVGHSGVPHPPNSPMICYVLLYVVLLNVLS